MAANITYHEQTDIDNIRKLREVLKTLPAFAKDYFRAIEPTTSTKTRISYAYDIRIFFQQLFRQPIVRNGRQATVGYCPEVWEKWE